MWLPGKNIPKFIKNVKCPVGVELGTAEGYTTKYLLKTIPNLTLYGIDPYTSFTDISGVLVDCDKNGQYEKFIKITNKFNDRYKHFKMTSDEAVNNFKDNSLDFIFIDGSHTYEQVLKDCKNYYPKIKKRGLFCGHDWSIIDVKNAVIEFIVDCSIKISVFSVDLECDVWFWYKK